MKIGSYQGDFVAVVHKLSNNRSRIQRVVPRPTWSTAWDVVGQPFDVDSVDVQPLEYAPSPLLGLVKMALTQDDYNRLSAARGLDLKAKGGVNRLGLKPSVKVYNYAVHKHKLAGAPIVPVIA